MALSGTCGSRITGVRDQGSEISVEVLRTSLQPFEDVGDEGAGKFAGQALFGCRSFVEEGGQVGGGLVLLAERVVLILVEHLAVAAGEGDSDNQRD